MSTNTENNRVITLPLADLVVDESDNARVNYDEIDSLAATIKSDGLISPPTAIEGEDGKFRLVAGFRRARAAKLAGLEQIPVVVRRNINRQGALFIQLAENVYRTDLTTYETAWSLKRIKDECNMSREELANRLHRSLSWLSNYLGLFDLPAEIIEMSKEGGLAVSHVRFLHSQMKYLDEPTLVELAHKVKGYNQAQLDAKRLALDKARRAPVATAEPEVQLAEETKAATAPQARKNETVNAVDELDDEDVEESDEEQEEELDFDPDSRRKGRRSYEDEDEEDDDGGAQIARSAKEINAAIKRLKSRSAKINSLGGNAKLTGLLEALQWVLGDDSPTF